MSRPVATLARVALNHALESEAWARARLAQHCGAGVELVVPPFKGVLQVEATGAFGHPSGPIGAAAQVVFSPSSTLGVLSQPGYIWKQAQVVGDTDFAQTLREILSRLTWDVEDDLARLIGDIPAERLTYHARSLAAWRFKAQAQIGQAITGYLRDPTSGLPARSEFHASQEEIRLIESEIDQLEVRIRALSGQ